jgi:hypothetical protein
VQLAAVVDGDLLIIHDSIYDHKAIMSGRTRGPYTVKKRTEVIFIPTYYGA